MRRRGLATVTIVACFMALIQAKVCSTPKLKTEDVAVLGRLALESHGQEQEEWLILHAQDATTYRIKGGLIATLRGVLAELGEDNLILVKGTQTTQPSCVSCKNTYGFDAEGKKTIDAHCISYYDLEVSQIIEAKQSDEKMPPPKRNVAEERAVWATVVSQPQPHNLMQLIEIKGQISALNFRAPIKTIEVTYQDKEGQPITKALLLNANTRIAKAALDTQQPMYVSEEALRIGQRINVIYARGELKNVALFITITKE